jgi:hypothetical protein
MLARIIVRSTQLTVVKFCTQFFKSSLIIFDNESISDLCSRSIILLTWEWYSNTTTLPQYLRLVWLEVEPIKPLRVNLAEPLRVSGLYDDYAYYERQVWAQNSVFLSDMLNFANKFIQSLTLRIKKFNISLHEFVVNIQRKLFYYSTSSSLH